MKLLALMILAAGAASMNLATHLQLEGTQLDLRGSAVTDADLAGLQEEHLRSVRSVLLASTSISDQGLSHLRGLPLVELDLDRTAVTNCGLEYLAGLPLRRLTLSGTGVDDAGLAELAGLPLEELRLANTAIGDGGLARLGSLPLRRLDLSRTQVSDAGLEALAGVQTLELVDLSSTRVTGMGLQRLALLPRLATIVAHEVPVSESERAEILRVRPQLRLVTDLPTR